jgi:hypothetical protein
VLLHSRSLRLSLIGVVVFALGVLSLLVLPAAISIAGILVGGMAVWAGFIWTLLTYYMQPPPETHG